MPFKINALALCLGAAAAMAAGPAQAETKSFVVGYFGQATYSQDGDCPGGINPDITTQYVRDLAGLGYTKQQITEMARKGGGEGGSLRSIMNNRARVAGKPANPYSFPASVADPNLSALGGKFAYGFNLDGRSDTGFEDPETHE